MKQIYLSLLFLQAFFLTKGIAQKIIIFRGDNIVIGKNISILEDRANRIDINAVRKSSGFIQSLTQVPNLQLSTSAFWLRFTIKNESSEKQLLLSLEYPTLDVCEFYFPVNGVYNTEKLSDNNSFYKRKYKHQDFLFDVKIPKDSTATFYLKVQSNEEMVLPLILGTPQKIAEKELTRDMLWGILVGILLVMILYNSFVFISTKDISYLYYVLYTLFIALTQTSLSGYTYRFLFPNHPLLFDMGIIIFNAIAGIAFSLFAQSFLEIKERMPIMSKAFNFLILLYSLTIIVRLCGYALISYRITDVGALLVTVIGFITLIRLSLKGYRSAKFFLLAWAMFFLGIVLFALRNLGVLPYNNYTNYTMPIGIAFEVILLSLALADRLNIFKAEKEKSQEETLRVLQENEKIIREQNVVLELKVNERTVELSESNHELNKTLDDLKQAQGQLVEAEKMASLGQLTAGIAHEINNPINFVTSNINPLNRDIKMVLEAITVIEEVGLSDAPQAEKQKKIKDYKEELDFNYLTMEIKQLIKGINDGANRTAEIVKGLKIFSRLDEDDLKMADMNEGLDSTLVIINNQLQNKIKVIKQYADLPLVECYPGKLNQVFLNIISNAIYAVLKKFGENTGGEIIINTSHDESNVYIKIKDNGTGMDAQTQKKIFEPFFTTKDVGEGTGLGMSIAYNTIKKHNGQIMINSTLNEGTEFILQLPMAAPGKPINQ
ncbi:7TM diverse intracellular signaling domain-containing protein [Mucilaginibacter sp.]|uniref:sensor histidine kinase n=1 Tax=Mucilaginibacter sp. TaxID=1882438 RepID=UPI00284B1044|nr:7TM diverse intracellular signaling domain-containing protein [Mucilaginibacter sp.]MDR3693631.1 7TM diverse intracellular signaling domain-containing protein [Mucilaginibacter sp.]